MTKKIAKVATKVAKVAKATKNTKVTKVAKATTLNRAEIARAAARKFWDRVRAEKAAAEKKAKKAGKATKKAA